MEGGKGGVGGKWEREKKGQADVEFHRWICRYAQVDICNALVECGYRVF